MRQLDGHGVHQQTRGHGFTSSVFVDQPPFEMDGKFRCPSRYEVSTRRSQRSGRCPQPSRASDRDRWSLHPQVARSLFRMWGNPSLDLFVTCLNAKLPLYCSLVPNPQAVFQDAFRHPWDDLDLYAFPPFPLVGRVIARVRESSRVVMTLVAPHWPEKEWFADLLLLLTQSPVTLPWWDSLLRQPHCNLFHQGVHALNLHALLYCVSHTKNWGEVSFSYVTGLVAKTQDPSSLAPWFEGFLVPALPNARNNRNGRLLCPVRTVRCYLDRTAAHRPRCDRLFITAGLSKKEISKTTVSFWLRKTVSRAYELSGTALPVPAPRARETRGIAPSLLFKKNFAVDQVLKAGTWLRHTTFSRHYLRDLAHWSLDTFHLGPVVAAQAVV